VDCVIHGPLDELASRWCPESFALWFGLSGGRIGLRQ